MTITKRHLLVWIVVLALFLAITPAQAQQTSFKEAPMLTALVQEGKLPPLDQRLPKNPAVVTPFKQVGDYGGELRFGFTGGSAAWGGMLYLAGWENPMIWKADFSGVVPNYLESLEANEDASVWTAKLREGIKWSDGQPFTTADISFYIESFLMNSELIPTGFAADWVPGDMAAAFKYETVDETTFKLIFPKSFGTLPLVLAQWQGRQFAMYPKHYLEKYHKDFNPAVDDLVKQEGVDNWVGLFMKYAPANWGDPDVAFFKDPNYPTLGPWRLVQPLGAGTTVLMERNPYYWKVDSAGNQLPYVDKLVGTQFQDDQARLLAMLNGDIDFLKDPTNDARPQFVEASDEGKVFINRIIPDGANSYVLQFNMTHADLGTVFSDKNFRIGVSYAINRPELIELFNQGLGVPSQVCPLPESPLYNEQCNTQFIEYDLAKANEYLDKVLPNKDANGMRLGPDGQPFTFILFVVTDWSWAPNNAQIGEKTLEYLKAVGLNVQLNAMPNDQFEPIRKSNQVQAFLSTGEGGAGLTALLDGRNFVPMEQYGTYGNGWTLWRMKNEGAPGLTNEVEPPQWVKDARQLFNDALSQPTTELQIETMRKVIAEATERFYQVGGYQGGEGWYPWGARMSNIPDEWYGGWAQGVFKNIYPEQWFLVSQ